VKRSFTQCFFGYGSSSQCHRLATEEIRGKAYCEEHAKQIKDQTFSDRRLALNTRRGIRSGGQLDRAVEVTIRALLAAATASLKRTKRVLLAARHPTVEERMNIRYRRGSLIAELDRDWSAAAAPHRGIVAYSVMEEHLRVLGGERSEDGFFIPRAEAYLGGGRSGLTKLKHSLDAALADVAVRRFIDERSHYEVEPGTLERSLLRSQELLNDCMSKLGPPRSAGRASNVSSDAAIVMLAGCWWLATGKWPPMSAQSKSHFYGWARSSVKRLNPDLASHITSNHAIYHALRRHPLGTTTLPGPWLARDVVSRKGAAEGVISAPVF
jgi:hypothetical protein